MKDATQINTAIPLVAPSESYADRLTRWMEDERWRDLMRQRTAQIDREARELAEGWAALLNSMNARLLEYAERGKPKAGSLLPKDTD